MRTFGNALDAHGSLLLDEARTRSYQQAILDTVKPRDVVLDLGCGTGLLAFFACQAGASRVFAIESGEVINVARMLSEQNGFDDRVRFIRGHSKEVELPEQVDVIVTETLGSFGVGEGISSAIIDARRRFLKPDGSIIPSKLGLKAAPVETAKIAAQRKELWSRNLYGLDYSPVRVLASNNPSLAEFRSEDLLGEPLALAELVFAEIQKAELQAQATWQVQRVGMLHGVAGWFEAELSAHIRLSNYPPRQNSCWEHAFFPIEQPVEVRKGDKIKVAIRVSKNEMLYQWHVEVVRQKGGEGENHGQVISFDQGGIKGIPHIGEWVDEFLSNA